MPFTSNINSSPFWAILFDMNYLFEKFNAYLFRESDIEFQEQSIIDCFKNKNFIVSAKPDYIINNKNIVADAKWKLLDEDTTLYGLNAQNFWQLFSYMNLISDEEINGYFIVPKNNDELDNEIVFEPLKQGNKSITILSIDFSLEFDKILENHQFKIKNNQLFFDMSLEKEKILLNMKEEFLQLRKRFLENKKYLRGLTQTIFREKYIYLTTLLEKMKNSFKIDKIFLEDIIKLSNTQFNNMFNKLIEDEENEIDIGVFIEYIANNPNSKYSKIRRKNRNSQSWRRLQ